MAKKAIAKKPAASTRIARTIAKKPAAGAPRAQAIAKKPAVAKKPAARAAKGYGETVYSGTATWSTFRQTLTKAESQYPEFVVDKEEPFMALVLLWDLQGGGDVETEWRHGLRPPIPQYPSDVKAVVGIDLRSYPTPDGREYYVYRGVFKRWMGASEFRAVKMKHRGWLSDSE